MIILTAEASERARARCYLIRETRNSLLMKSPSGGRAAGKAPSATTVNVVPGLFTELDW